MVNTMALGHGDIMSQVIGNYGINLVLFKYSGLNPACLTLEMPWRYLGSYFWMSLLSERTINVQRNYARNMSNCMASTVSADGLAPFRCQDI